MTSGATPPPLIGAGNPVPRAKWVWLAPTLVVVVLVSAVAAFFVASRTTETIAGPERVGELFLEAVATDDLSMSYGLLCQKQRLVVNSFEFRDDTLDDRDDARRALARGEPTVTGSGDVRRITYTVPGDGPDLSVRLRLERERDREGEPVRWAVCAFTTDADSAR